MRVYVLTYIFIGKKEKSYYQTSMNANKTEEPLQVLFLMLGSQIGFL